MGCLVTAVWVGIACLLAGAAFGWWGHAALMDKRASAEQRWEQRPGAGEIIESRSVQRRLAHQRGERPPSFEEDDA